MDLLRKVRSRLDPEREVIDLFQDLRISGNDASHEFVTSFKQAMDGLRAARTLAIWYNRSFGTGEGFFDEPSGILPIWSFKCIYTLCLFTSGIHPWKTKRTSLIR